MRSDGYARYSAAASPAGPAPTIAAPGGADQYRAAGPGFYQFHALQEQGAHDAFAECGLGNDQRAR